MNPKSSYLTGRERTFGNDEIIVSKTDTKGIITYANQVFCRVAAYNEAELIGKPHNIVRHPHMPRSIFRFLWDSIRNGEEIFAYVLNRAKNGDGYWVFAHVTPTFDDAGRIVGYHSNRRAPDRDAVATMRALYASLLKEEQRHTTAKEAMDASFNMLLGILNEKKVSYEELIFSLAGGASAERKEQSSRLVGV